MMLHDASIKQRLTAIIVAASTISVLLTTLTISIIGVYNLRQGMVEEMAVSASIVGDRNVAALLFNDDRLAEANMRVFSVKRSILRACLYNRDGTIFARYVNDEHFLTECPADLAERTVMGQQTLEVMKPIVRDKDTVGSIYIESDLRDIKTYIQKQTYIAISVSIAVLLVSCLLALRLQRYISQPILSLARTAREISQTKDYSVRAQPFGKHNRGATSELATLTEAFNGMLIEIGARETRLRQQNIELERARDSAEAANRAKSQFLANISHELRTPLNAIIGFSSILMNQLFGPMGDTKYLEYSRDIHESGTHLLDTINDILDLAKAEAGRLELNYEEIHVAKAINKCATIVADRAQKGGVTLTCDVPKHLPPLMADRLRFIQIVLNIVSNAIKFTESGGKVGLTVGTREQGGDVAEFIIVVRDTGIGMKQEDIDKAFQSFGQVDGGLNRKYEGTGLGLPLTKKLLEVHGGNIVITSEVGMGTTVVMTFPAVPPIQPGMGEVVETQ